jgi:antitoxin HicB
MNDLAYPFTVRPLADEDGSGWLVEFPDLPGCIADGATPEEALHEAQDALRSWLETARKHGDPIPLPTRADAASYSGKWVLRAPKSLHKRLSDRARTEGVSLNTLAVSLLSEGLGSRGGDGRR